MVFSYAGKGRIPQFTAVQSLGLISYSYTSYTQIGVITETVSATDINNNLGTLYTRTTYSTGGTGTGSLGGFNIGPHIRFGTNVSGYREVRFYLDLANVEEITFTGIKGNGSNGGEEPDFNENLRIQYTGVSGYQTLIAENDTSFNSLNSVTLPVPFGARNNNQQVVIYQQGNSGYQFDHYGIQSISYGTPVVLPVPDLLEQQFTYLDFGAVGLDYWDLDTYQNVVLDTIKDEQLINLTVSGDTATILDYGFITQIEAVGTEDWGLITVSSNITPYGFLHFQSLTTWSVVNTWVGTGTVWEMDGGTRYRLDAPWIGSGTLRYEGSAITNYVPSIAAEGILPLRSDTKVAFSPNWNSFGTIFAGGITSESITKIYNQTSDFNIGGTASIIASLRHIGSGTLFSINTAVTIRTYDYVGEGSLFTVTGTSEAVTYDYNLESIVYFEYEDFGLVSELPIDSIVLQTIANDPLSLYANDRIVDLVVAGSTSGDFIDYGDLLIDGQDPPETLQTDWGYIWETYTKYPMGLGKLRGNAEIRFTPNYVGSGGLFAFVEGIGRTKPRWIAYVNLAIYGESITNFSLLHIGSGSLFSLSNAQDSVLYNYSGSGDLYAFSGAADAVGFNPPEETFHLVFGGAATVSFAPNWIAEGSLDISGTAIERNTESYNGSGTLFNFDNKVERRTYSYNSSSNVLFVHLDYGSVAENPIDSIVLQTIANDPLSLYANDRIVDLVVSGSISGSFYDYGSIITDGQDQPETVTDDYEYITETISRYAFGDLLFEGVADTPRSRSYVGTGDIKLWIDGIGRTKPRWIADVIVDVFGASVNTTSKAYKGAGVLPTLINTTDSRTFAYEGRGDLFAISGGEESVTFDYPKPDQDIKVTGAAAVAYVPNWNGSGSIGTSGELVERVAYDIVGSGVLYSFETLVERRVYHYNTTSIDEYVHLDYGLVSSPAIDSWVIDTHSTVVLQTIANTKIIDLTESGSSGNYFDYGYLEQPLDAGLFGVQDAPDVTDDYQYILDSATIYPFGRLQLGLTSVDTVTLFSLLHIGNPEGTQIKISGEVAVRLPNVHQGSGTFFAIEGAAESAAFSPDNLTGLFEFVGFAATRRIPNFNGGGTITLDGEAYSTVAFAGFQENTIQLRGTATEKYTPVYEGYINIGTFSGAAESASFNPLERQILFSISGIVSEKVTNAYEGRGDLFAINGAVESASVAEDKRILISISGSAAERYVPNWNGSGSISVLSGAAESRTASPDDLTGLFEFVGFGKVKASVAESGLALIKVSGSTAPEILTFAEQLFGRVSLFGTATERYVPNWNGSGFISTLSGAAESFTVNPQEKDLLFSITGRGTQSFSFGNYDGDANVRIYGQLAKTPNLTFAEQPVVQTSIFGEAEVINVDVYLAEGTIFGRGLVSESKTVKLPPIVPADIRLSGTALEAVSFNPPDITTEIKLSGAIAEPRITFAEQPTVRVAISGVAVEKNTEAYLGTGVIFSNGLGGESVTRKLPEFTAHLNVNGVASESATFREIFFGSLFKFSGTTGPAIRSYAEQPQTLGQISGVAVTTRARDFVGSGRIATLSGAAEAVTFNPLERQLLFSVDGRAATRYSRTWVGSGNISLYTEASRIKFVPNWIAEGTLPVSGIAEYRTAKDFIGDIKIGTFSGAAESVTFNPLERDMLFSFTGRASIRSAVSEVKQVELAVFAEPVIVHTVQVPPAGEGLVQTSGEGRIVITLSYVGDIRIGTFSGAAEAVTFNPLERDLLFSATGFATAIRSRAYYGSGSLYAISGAAESRTIVPPVSGLFTFTGDTRFSTTKPFIGSGNLFSVVSSQEKVAYDYVGEQVLFSLSGAAKERITSSEVVFGSIFSFSGAAERVAYVPSLLADVNISGVAATPRARNFVGSGDLPVFGGAAEARTITYENVAIFDFLGQVKPAITKAYVGEAEVKISGAAEDSFTRAPYSGQIEVSVAGTASESATFNPPEEGTEIRTSGEVKVLRSFGYEGSGTINVRGDAIIGIRIRIFGSGGARLFGQARVQALLSHKPDVHLYFEGQASTARIQVSPPRTYGWII